jgi:hypothetical protein
MKKTTWKYIIYFGQAFLATLAPSLIDAKIEGQVDWFMILIAMTFAAAAGFGSIKGLQDSTVTDAKKGVTPV